MQAAAAAILCEINFRMALQAALPAVAAAALHWRDVAATQRRPQSRRRAVTYSRSTFVYRYTNERMYVCM